MPADQQNELPRGIGRPATQALNLAGYFTSPEEEIPAMPKNPVVDKFMANLNHPHKEEIEKLREIILGASSKLEEDIKWKCPTFTYNGNLASIVVRTKQHAQVMFHAGATLKDDTGLLEGDGQQVRYARFQNMAEVKQKRKALEAVVKQWVKLKS